MLVGIPVPILRIGGGAATGMGNTLKRFWHEEQGQDLVEYALVIALIGLVSIVALDNVATAHGGVYKCGG